MHKISRNSWIERFNKIHNGFYSYERLENDILSSNHITITCPLHGDFKQKANDHGRGIGCKECSKMKISKSKQKSIEQLKNEIKKVWVDSVTVLNDAKYNGTNNRMKFQCVHHGVFYQRPHSLLDGYGCKRCSGRVYDVKNFIEKAKKVHFNKYSYKKSVYKGTHNFIIITCPKHGDFKQKVYSHLNGQGCPMCNTSMGELLIKDILSINKIEFELQKVLPECKYKRHLRFDFYIPKINTCIEYDGLQHFKLVNFKGKMTNEQVEKLFELTKIKDQIKNEYCQKNNIRLIRFNYKQKDEEIRNILESIIR